VPERDLSVPVVMGSADDFYPYAFTEGGPLKGFSVDIAEAVARAVKLQIALKPTATDKLETLLLEGAVDALPFWSETKARRAVVDFSVPVVRFETVVVVRKDEKAIRSVADLKGHRVAVGPKGTVSELYVMEKQPEAVRVYSKNTEEFLRLLSGGDCDAAVMSRLTAVSRIERYGMKNLRVLQGVQGYDVRYCMAVRKGDALLLARFNEGLAIIHRTGEYEDIYQKWFGRFEQKALTPFQLISYVAAALALICAGATWGFLRQRTLLRRIAGQAAELAEQRSLLEALYDKHPLATVVIDIPVQGPCILVSLNQEASLLFAIGKTTSAGQRLDELNLTKEMRLYLEDAVARHRAGGLSARWEARLPVSQRVLEVVTMPLGSSKGGSRLCVLSADITKRRLMDQEIAKSRRLRALGELVGGIAHEFNNLLTPIMATASMLRCSPPPAVVSEAELDIIDQSARRAADLTKRLLAFGRKTDDPARTVRLTEAVANCEALLKTMIDRRIEWENDLPADLPPVVFNPTDFNQIVFNLVLNARDTLLEKLAKNTDPAWRPHLRVSVSEHPVDARLPRTGVSRDGLTGWQRFSVEDNGLGIPHEIVDRIFEPFFTTKEVGKGTGLGLSTVWHQVTDAGGEVVVDSKPGEGTAFHIYLPRRDHRPAQTQPVEPAQPGPAAATVTGKRILIVEDELLISSAAASILQRLGHVVALRSDGVEAWNELVAGGAGYDLLLIDLSMPRMSGIDLVKQVRTLSYAGAIVVMSGRVTEEDLQTLKTLQIDRILAKPFTAEQLTAVVAEVVAAHKG
jgi:signal transduction histidine kinase/ActR/RegA family two-component response regulator